MEIGERAGQITRRLVVSAAILSLAVGYVPAGAEEMPTGTAIEAGGNPDGMVDTSIVITGEPQDATTLVRDTSQETDKPKDTDDGWDTLGEGLQFFGIMGLLAVATGFFDSPEDSRRRRRR